MKTKYLFPFCFIILCSFSLPALAQGTAFTYQGQLTESGTPANGVYDLQFRLLASTNVLSLPIGILTMEDTGVTNGLFTVPLGFGVNAFDGNPRWLEISVRPGASGDAYTNLAPLQLVTATPYAIRALQVGSNGLAAGAYANPVSFNNPGNSFTGNGTGLTNVSATTLGGLGTANFWQTGGNSGTTPGANFLGTTDNQPLEFKVNGSRALRLEPTAGAPNVIGGAANNQITAPTAGGGVLSGHGHRIFNASDYSVIAGGFSNRIQISSPGGFIGGGQFNWIVNSSTNSVIGGGASNQITDPHSFIGGGFQQTNRSSFAFIGGGYRNDIGADSDYGAIGGGRDNAIAANSLYATIAGGYLNDIGTNSDYSAISGGINNNIAANSRWATIAGGGANDIGTSADYSAIGGGRVNTIAATALYATIAGGYLNEILNSSDFSVVAGGFSNRVQVSSPGGAIGGGQLNRINNYNTNSVIAGGYANQIGVVSDAAAISGGKENLVANFSSYAAIAGGYQNDIATASTYSAIGGGRDNNVAANSISATIPGGYLNDIGTNSDYSAIGGGALNQIEGNSGASTISGGRKNGISQAAAYGSIGGGNLNKIGANSTYATIGGGNGNTIGANSALATIPGGRFNFATNYAFAAGRKAKANHTGAFVWADSEDADFASQGDNQFRVRADGGARFDFNAGEWVDLRYTSNSFFSARIIMTSSGGYLSLGGTWVNASDRERKSHFTPVDPQAVLAKVAAMPLSEWSYKTEGETTRHLGPVAQDFHAAFGLGGDSKAIATVDADGVALAAIQGLNQKLESGTQKTETRMEKLEAENAELKTRLEKLEQLMNQRNGDAR